MPILNDKQYECDFCHGVFNFVRDENWSEEKANKEYKENFPSAHMGSRDIVCDDCWQIVKPDA